MGSIITLGQQSTRSYNDAEGIESLINAYYISIGHYARNSTDINRNKISKDNQNSQTNLPTKRLLLILFRDL